MSKLIECYSCGGKCPEFCCSAYMAGFGPKSINPASESSKCFKDKGTKQFMNHIQNICDVGGEDCALKAISLILHHMKEYGHIAEISDEFCVIDVENFSDIILISLLRNTYTTRTSIPYWNEFLRKVDDILTKRRGKHKLLRGLRAYE